jgi:7-cyano-7-deazaguanine synthase
LKLLLFSGGIDSTALAWSERPDQLLFVDYGQCSAEGESRAAFGIAKALDLPISIREVSFKSMGSGSLAGGHNPSAVAPEFWPFRNQMLITIAVMAYAASEPLEVLIGTVASDVIHPDGRQAFLAAASDLVGLQGQYSVRAPASDIDSSALLKRSMLPSEILGWTFSCHTGEWACGQCRGCRKHDEVVREYEARG